MSRSTISCPACGSADVVYWAVIDARERIDLLGREHLLAAACYNGHTYNVDDVVVIAGLTDELPLLVGLSTEPGADQDDSAAELLASLHSSLGRTASDLGDYVFYLTQEALTAVVGWHIRGEPWPVEATQPRQATEAPTVQGLAGLVSELLSFAAYQRNRRALHLILASSSSVARLAEASKLVQDWPGVLAVAQAQLDDAMQAAEQPRELIMHIQMQLATRLAGGQSVNVTYKWLHEVLAQMLTDHMWQPLQQLELQLDRDELDAEGREILAREGLELLGDGGPSRPRARFLAEYANAVLRQGQRSRVHEAVASYDQALALLPDFGEDAAGTLTLDLQENLGIALVEWYAVGSMEHTRGEALLHGCAKARSSNADYRWTISYANLANAIITRADTGKPEAQGDLLSALGLLDEVLANLTPRLDARTTAQVHHLRGFVHIRLAELPEPDPSTACTFVREAIASYQRGLGVCHDATDLRDFEQALSFNLGVAYRALAHQGVNVAENVRLALGAFQHSAATARVLAQHRELGRSLVELVMTQLESDEPGAQAEAVHAAHGVSQHLQDDVDVLLWTDSVAAAMLNLEAWDLAAILYGRAARGLDQLALASPTGPARTDLLRRYPTLHRWAAYAAYRTGDLATCVKLLEAGRARAVGTTLAAFEAQLHQLHAADPPLAQRFEAARREIGPQLRHVVDQIRLVPGWERFMLPPDTDELLASQPREWPLVYVLLTPSGAVIIVAGGGACSALDLPALTSTSLAEVLTAGPAPFLLASTIGGQLVQAALDAFAAATAGVGDVLASELRKRGAEGIDLVVCGPHGLMPWHDLRVKDGRLSDHFAIALAPSAGTQRHARRRAERLKEAARSMFVMADPDGSLPSARAEVAHARLFADTVVAALGREATLQAWQEQAPGAKYLHLACHGTAGWANAEEAGLDLADQRLDASRLRAMDLNARLVSLMACTSASYDAATPDELVGLPALFLEAGASAVLATLWPIDDMTASKVAQYFYKHLHALDLVGGVGPGVPARALQLALKDLRRKRSTWRTLISPSSKVQETSLSAFVVVGA